MFLNVRLYKVLQNCAFESEKEAKKMNYRIEENNLNI